MNIRGLGLQIGVVVGKGNVARLPGTPCLAYMFQGSWPLHPPTLPQGGLPPTPPCGVGGSWLLLLLLLDCEWFCYAPQPLCFAQRGSALL